MTGNDQRRVLGHACPECPTPHANVNQLLIPPTAHCRYCHGSGLVSEQVLAAWLEDQWRGAQV